MDLLKEIGEAKKIAISGHVRPDGDAIGSTLALWKYLTNACPGAEITVYCDVNPPTIFACLAGYELMNQTHICDCAPDVFLALDVSAPDRIGRALEIFESARKTINIDHHESNVGFCDASVIVPDASSTCEVLFDLLEDKYIDDEVAKSLYTGIVSDSGVFQYSNMSRHSFEIVGKLVEYDFDGPRIIEETFYQKSYVQNQILGRALLESILLLDGKIIVSVIDQKMMDFYGVLPKHLEGIVNQLRYTKGVDVAILMYEMGMQKYKVSMRSTKNVNVADVAVIYGGGGHAMAAGVEMNGNRYDVINALTEQISKQLRVKES